MNRTQMLLASFLVIPGILAFSGCQTSQTPLRDSKSTSTPDPQQPDRFTNSHPGNGFAPVLPLPDVGDIITPSPGALSGEGDAAVIVAIEQYAQMQPISGAVLNADAWNRYFAQSREIKHIEYLKDSNATDHMIRKAIAEMKQHVSASGRLWFVFIGHGAPGKPGKGGLMVGYDAEPDIERIAARSISQEELTRALMDSKGHGVAIIDACFSGLGPEGKLLIPGIQPPNLEPPKTVKSSHRMVTITSAMGSQYAGPLPGTARPAFSYLFLGALRGWGDQDKNGIVTADEATAYVHRVLVALNREQTPSLQGKKNLALSNSRESEPDIEIFLPTRLNSASELNANNSPVRSCSQPHFGPTWPPLGIPRFFDSWNSGRATSGSMESDAAYIQARAAQAEGQRNPVLAKQSWCSLSQIMDDNPYVSVAKIMCERWQTFTIGVAWLGQDLACLSVLLDSTSHLSDQQKQQRINEFALRYGELDWIPAIQRLHTRMPVPMRSVSILATSGSVYVDRELVSVEAYTRCVDRGFCTRLIWNEKCSTYVAPKEPATCVSGAQASMYCRWLGKTLVPREVLEQAIRGRRMQEEIVLPSGDVRELASASETEIILFSKRGAQPATLEGKYRAVGFRCARYMPSHPL